MGDHIPATYTKVYFLLSLAGAAWPSDCTLSQFRGCIVRTFLDHHFHAFVVMHTVIVCCLLGNVLVAMR